MSTYTRLVFWTFAQKLKAKKTKTQAQKTRNTRIFCPKLKISAIIFFRNLRRFSTKYNNVSTK